jgi:membrane protein DedA with SNARE-associated domain
LQKAFHSMPAFALHPASYLGIIFFLFLTGMGLPVPEEVPVILAGVLAANGTLEPWLALASCVFGALVSDCILYAVGRHFGRGLL